MQQHQDNNWTNYYKYVIMLLDIAFALMQLDFLFFFKLFLMWTTASCECSLHALRHAVSAALINNLSCV